MGQERLDALRQEMASRNIDIYIVPTADYHESEYVGEYFKARRFLTGFTGSAGVAVVTRTEAGLWTDGRYFIQAEREIRSTGFTLFKMAAPGVPTVNEFTEDRLPQGGTIGFDGRVINANWGKQLEAIAERKQAHLKVSEDLVDLVWKDRPQMSCQKAWILEEKYAGRSLQDKLKTVRKAMKQEGCDGYLLTSLDDIAWLLNLRGGDAIHFPIVLSYVFIQENSCVFYVQKQALTEEVLQYLEKNNISVKSYFDVYQDMEEVTGNLLMDLSKVNYRLYSACKAHGTIHHHINPTVLLKAVKNPVEAENIRKAHVEDGVAMVKWLYWLDRAMEEGEVTELSASDKLAEFRASRPGFLDLSFNTIAAYEANGAMMHYSATPDSFSVLKKQGFFLVDSGGHYLDGTTDITRTMAMGPITEEQRRFFTLVLRSNLTLANAHFLEGVNGQNLDILARGPFWDLGLDYRCGTGHGVGYVLNVHEAPNGFRWRVVPERNDSAPLEPGMVTTDEPGIYLEGKFGIRLENELLCVEDQVTEYGRFLKFENITYCPMDLDAIDVAELTTKEKKWLNDYHKTVYTTLAPYLTDPERAWLLHETREV